jgi:HSP20 family protein
MQIKDLLPWARKGDAPEGQKPAETNAIAALQREMNQVFENFWSRFGKPFGTLDWPWGQSEAKADVVQTDNAVEISIELPGMEMKDIEVSVADDMLTVKGEKRIERQEEKKGYYLSERSYGAIYRAIPLPPGVDGSKAEATFKNGVLTIRLPQTPEAQAKVRRVEVKAG